MKRKVLVFCMVALMSSSMLACGSEKEQGNTVNEEHTVVTMEGEEKENISQSTVESQWEESESVQESEAQNTEESNVAESVEPEVKTEIVKKIKSEIRYNNAGKCTKKLEYEYDERGNLIKMTEYSDATTVYTWEEYDYDENDNRIALRMYKNAAKGDMLLKEEKYEYDETNFMVREGYYTSGVLRNSKEYSRLEGENGQYTLVCKEYNNEVPGGVIEDTYTAEGVLIRHAHFNGDGALIGEDLYTQQGFAISETRYFNGEINEQKLYNENGDLLTYKAYDSYGNMITDTTYEYNAAGQKVRYSGTAMGLSVGVTVYEHDSAGKWIKSISLDNNGNPETWYTEFFDDKGNVIKKESHDASEGLIYYWIWEFDQFGNTVKGEWFKGNGTLEGGFVNEYDAEGNMLKASNYKPMDPSGTIDNWADYEYVEIEVLVE